MQKCIVTIFCIFVFGCTSVPKNKNPKVQVTLSDGQKIVGLLSTTELTLSSSLGELKFSTADAGELGLFGSENIEQSENKVRLWLRNGSEFVGLWQKPSINMLMELGGKKQQIQIPISKLKRMQFQSKEVWPTQAVFRILTHEGDDFFVDVTKTQMIFANEMGTFVPFLSEVSQLQKSDNNWRIYLQNGSVFIAKLQQEHLDLHLTMGPRRLAVPLTAIKMMNREELLKPSSQRMGQSMDSPSYQPTDDGLSIDEENSFFSNEMQKNAKDQSNFFQNN
ncbi:hypothetical protein [Candidatus Uabimicrobium sp. HlEnr_7]|uniref:hypothetical protein n=1 Tax=Candidatus Uabimicrobium helgolandensis TaxID=3095367 RepID=UPI003556B1A3